MTERILELAEQAGISFYPGQFNQVPVADITIMDIEKFSELIVREVLNKIENERFELPECVITVVKDHFDISELNDERF